MIKFWGQRFRLLLLGSVLLLGGVLFLSWPSSWQGSPAHAQSSQYQLSRLYYLTRVIFLINRHYVDQLQIDTQKMFKDALLYIQMTVPSVMVRFRNNDTEVEVLVDKARKVFKLQSFTIIFNIPYQLSPIFSFIEANYRGDVEQREIEFAAIHGMLKSLDPHTGFLPPSFYLDMQAHTRGSFGGLGIVIQSRDGYLTVVTPMPDTPAAKVGLKALDQIVRIGDESTINMSLNEAVSKLRGEPGSKVEIWIQRKGFSQPKRFVIVRAIINVKSVSANLLPNQIGYVRVKNFQEDTAPDIRKALLDFHRRSQGQLRGLILDLRNNPGGLLSQAIKVSDLFLDKGVIVTHAGGVSQREVHEAHAFGTEPKYPIVVLINEGSASASEIVAGALKNHNRALLIGQRTYGKGTVQILYPITSPRYVADEKSALKLTVAQYLTPGDISIQDIGIVPDITVNPVVISDQLVHFFQDENRKQKKKKLPNYLKGVQEARNSMFTLSYLDNRSDKEREESSRENYDRDKKLQMDFEITMANQLLLRAKQWHRLSFYKKAKPELEKMKQAETDKLHLALKKLGVDWEDDKQADRETPKLSFQYRILPPKKKNKHDQPPRGNRVWAGSNFRLQITMRNRGKYPVSRLRAITQSPDWFLQRKEFVFGKLAPGQSKQWIVDAKLPLWVKTHLHSLKVHVYSAQKSFHWEKSIDLQIMGLPQPRYDFSYALEEIKGNGDGQVQAGESFALRLTVRNSGEGKSLQAIGMLRNKTGRELFIERGRIQFGELKTGQHATGWFYLRVSPHSQHKVIKMHVVIFDAELNTTARKEIELPVVDEGLKKMKLRRWIQVHEPSTWLYSGADFNTSKVAHVLKGTRMKVTAQLGNFYEVSLGDQMWGTLPASAAIRHKPLWKAWVAARDVLSLASATKSSRQQAKMYWQAVTPQVTISTTKYPKALSQPQYILKGEVVNNVALLDAYILVNGEKVFYRSLQNIPKFQFSLPIRLKEGRNRVSVVARESTQFSGYKEILLYRTETPAKKLSITQKNKATKDTVTP